MTTQKTRFPAATLLAAALALFAGAGAQAQTYTKVGTAQDSLPATAQITRGVGALQGITGAFTFTTTGSERATVNVSNPDLFQIRIDGSAPFSATTLGQPSDLFNPQLFLFNAAGAGVYYNDDASAFTTGALINPTTSPAPGLYFLGIATYGVVPRSGGTTAAFDMFANSVDDTTITDFTGLRTPKPGVTGPVTNWFLSGADVETGSYSIALSGASFAAAPVPEASTTVSFGLLALGLGGLVVAARRKKIAP